MYVPFKFIRSICTYTHAHGRAVDVCLSVSFILALKPLTLINYYMKEEKKTEWQTNGKMSANGSEKHVDMLNNKSQTNNKQTKILCICAPTLFHSIAILVAYVAATYRMYRTHTIEREREGGIANDRQPFTLARTHTHTLIYLINHENIAHGVASIHIASSSRNSYFHGNKIDIGVKSTHILYLRYILHGTHRHITLLVVVGFSFFATHRTAFS